MNRIFCVISHTHWDREWYMTFDQFRLRLVDLIDHLLNIIEQYPEYIFHLDAQTIMLEDYLEIRPNKSQQLKQYVKSGNIVIGPWYLQNDFYLTSGEATIRNLLEGRRIANEFGRCGKVGYAPDQFGCISQLPQILKGFGIDNFVFGRGYSIYNQDKDGKYKRVKTPSEFIWQGADGTKVLAICMRYWYNNAQRFSADEKKAKHLVELVEKSFDGVAATPYLLLMNGVDHLEAQDDLMPILEKLNKKLEDGKYIRQYDLGQYVNEIQRYISNESVSMSCWKGELRSGHDFDLLKGTLSSRHYLKVANVRAQNLLENRLEPLYAILENAGCRGIYSIDHFHYMWKLLMRNQPHDSICGCSRDEVHKHMEDRFGRLHEFTQSYLQRGLQEIAYHSSAAGIYGNDYIFTAINTLGCSQGGIIEAELLFPVADDVQGFTIYDSKGLEVPFEAVKKSRYELDVMAALNLPGRVAVDSWRIYLKAEELPAFSIHSYKIIKSEKEIPLLELINSKLPILENNALRVEIHPDGRIDLTDRASGRVLKDFLYLEDSADRGDSYVYFSTEDPVLDSYAFTPKIELEEKNIYRQRVSLSWEMELPISYNFTARQRDLKTAVSVVKLELILSGDDATLEVRYFIDNHSCDHRLRLVVKTDGIHNQCYADTPFDLIERTASQHFQATMSRVFPNTSFTALENGGTGTAVFTEGAHEFEQTDDQKLAFSILRATGVITRNVTTLERGGGVVWDAPGNQCLRKIEGRIGIRLYTGGYIKADLPQYAQRFRNPLMSVFASQDRRKFAGGRTAVQETSLEEFFYSQDPYENICIAEDCSAVEIDGRNILVSAFKKSENGHGLIVRLWYYGTTPDQVVVQGKGAWYQTDLAEENDALLGLDRARLNARPNEIITLRLKKS